ncbi:hypothetical protein BKA23_0597 [Rudaeicoccus suwonensis]|uniref:Uncharacterized protein n=1 Tax=Rudaeicoccus suwonensis TaxID=657409 RepID=A0A561E8C7_9MICO|nr:hypothetical protein BKA23_0597 [Rudaeicoccus suwonensis]
MMREAFGAHATHEATPGATSARYRLCGHVLGARQEPARSRGAGTASVTSGISASAPNDAEPEPTDDAWVRDLRVRTERRTPIINAFIALPRRSPSPGSSSAPPGPPTCRHHRWNPDPHTGHDLPAQSLSRRSGEFRGSHLPDVADPASLAGQRREHPGRQRVRSSPTPVAPYRELPPARRPPQWKAPRVQGESSRLRRVASPVGLAARHPNPLRPGAILT